LIVIQIWVVIPVWLLWSIIGFWIVKDVVLFPFIWRAYDWDRPGRSRSMVGKRGIAKEKLAPSGYIQIHGELWRAERLGEGPPIEEGQPVRVKKMEGLTLFIVLDNTEDRGQKTGDRRQGTEDRGQKTEAGRICKAEFQMVIKFESPRQILKLCYNLRCESLCLPSASLTLSRSSLDFYYGHGYR
jgi:membrane protein implicated in regulation of membrane protease activity